MRDVPAPYAGGQVIVNTLITCWAILLVATVGVVLKDCSDQRQAAEYATVLGR